MITTQDNSRQEDGITISREEYFNIKKFAREYCKHFMSWIGSEVKHFLPKPDNPRFNIFLEGVIANYVTSRQNAIRWGLPKEEVGRLDTQLSHLLSEYPSLTSTPLPDEFYEGRGITRLGEFYIGKPGGERK